MPSKQSAAIPKEAHRRTACASSFFIYVDPTEYHFLLSASFLPKFHLRIVVFIVSRHYSVVYGSNSEKNVNFLSSNRNMQRFLFPSCAFFNLFGFSAAHISIARIVCYNKRMFDLIVRKERRFMKERQRLFGRINGIFVMLCVPLSIACCILFIYCQSAALSAVSANCILADSSLFDWAHPSVSPESFDAVRVLRSHSDCLYFGSGIVLQHPLSNLQPSCARLRRLVFLSAGDCYFLFSHPDTIRRSQVFLLFDVLHLLFSCGLCPLGAWTNFLLCIYRAHAVCFADLFAARFILASRHCRIRYPDGMQAIQTNSYLSLVYIRRFLRAQHQILR